MDRAGHVLGTCIATTFLVVHRYFVLLRTSFLAGATKWNTNLIEGVNEKPYANDRNCTCMKIYGWTSKSVTLSWFGLNVKVGVHFLGGREIVKNSLPPFLQWEKGNGQNATPLNVVAYIIWVQCIGTVLIRYRWFSFNFVYLKSSSLLFVKLPIPKRFFFSKFSKFLINQDKCLVCFLDAYLPWNPFCIHGNVLYIIL